MRRVLSALALLVACKRDAPPTATTADASTSAEPAKSADVVASASASSSTAAIANPSAETPSPRTETKAVEALDAPESGDLENPVAKLGKLVVWGVPDGEATRLVAKRAGEKPKLLRRTSGKVKAIDAVSVGDDVAVAWASELAEGGTQVVAVVTATGDLSKVTAPATVAMVAAPIQLEGHVALARNPKGGLIVVHQGPTASCKLMDQPTECVSFEVKAVSASGVVTKLANEKLHGGPSPEYRVLDVDGRALAVLASSMRGGRTLAGVVVPYDASDPKPAFAVPICGASAAHFPELVRGSNGEIVSLCLDSRFDNPKCGKPLRGDGDRCLRASAVALDGKDLVPSVKGRAVAVQKVECAPVGHPRLVFDGAPAIELSGNPEVVRDFAPSCGK